LGGRFPAPYPAPYRSVSIGVPLVVVALVWGIGLRFDWWEIVGGFEIHWFFMPGDSRR